MTAEKARRWPKRGCLWREAVISAYAETGSYTEAARIALTSRRAILRLRTKDPKFDEAMTMALNMFVDRLEALVDQRAFEGVEEPVYQGGVLVGFRRVFSDRLAELRLKALRPEVYRDRKPAASGPTEIIVVTGPPRSGDDGIPPASRPRLPLKPDPGP